MGPTQLRESAMEKYLVTYHGPAIPSNPIVKAVAKATFGAWKMTTGDAIIDPGLPTHPVGQVSKSDETKGSDVTSYMVIQAESVDAAKAVLAKHPYVSNGGTLVIHEMIEM